MVTAPLHTSTAPDGPRALSRTEWAVAITLGVLTFFVPLALTYLTGVDRFKWLIADVTAPILAATLVTHHAWRGQLALPRSPVVIAAVAYAATAAISLLGALNPGFGLPDVLNKTALAAALFVAFTVARNARARDGLFWAIAACGLLVSCYGIAQHFGHDFFPWAINAEVPIERGVSTFGHSTFAASFLILSIPTGLALAITRARWWESAAAGWCVLPMLYHLSFTGARGAALAFTMSSLATVALGLVALGRKRPPRKTLAAALAVLTVAALGGAFLLVSAWREKDSDVGGFRQASGAVRVFTWETAARVFVDHPLFGAGAGNYELVSPADWNVPESDRYTTLHRMSSQVHNEYLEAAAEQGILGAAALVALVFSGIVAAATVTRAPGAPWREKAIGLALFAALTAGACDALLIFNFQAPGSGLTYWVLLGIAAAQRPPSPAP